MRSCVCVCMSPRCTTVYSSKSKIADHWIPFINENRKCDASHKLQMTNEIEIGWCSCCCWCFGSHVHVYLMWLKIRDGEMTKMTTIDVCECVCEVIKANHYKRHITYKATSIIGCQRSGKWVVALWNWICKHQFFFTYFSSGFLDCLLDEHSDNVPTC